MDIQNLTNVSTVVINSLLILLKDNHVDVNSVVMQLSNNKDEAISPEVNLGELTQQTLDELQKAKAQKVAVPKGFVLMPIQPTKEMIKNATREFYDLDIDDIDDRIVFSHQAMIEAQEQVG